VVADVTNTSHFTLARRVTAEAVVGAGSATALFRWLVPSLPEVAPTVVVPHTKAVGEAGRPG
jgi:hypothetical protein